MYCVHCGSPMGEDDRYCGRCGLPSEVDSRQDSLVDFREIPAPVYAPLDVMMGLSSEQDDKADKLPEQSVSPCTASVYVPPDVMWRQAQEGDGVDESARPASASGKGGCQPEETSGDGDACPPYPQNFFR